MSDLEKCDEEYLVSQIEARGGRCKKLVEVGSRGFPDRQVFYRSRKPSVELKREALGVARGSLSPQQIEVHRQLNAAGCDVYILWGMLGVNMFLSLLFEGGLPPDRGNTFHLPVAGAVKTKTVIKPFE